MMLSQVSMVDDEWVKGAAQQSEGGQGAADEEGDNGGRDHEILKKLHPRALEILRGATNDLPAMPSNVIRVFLSSTFSG